MKTFTVNANDSGQRLDKFITKAVKGLPMSLMYKYIRKKRIKVNGRRAEEKQKLSNMFDFIVNVHDELVGNKEKAIAKKLYTETHFVSLIPYIKEAIENNISESMVAEWVVNFFKTENDTEVYDKYNNACSGGVAKNASVVARHEALGESYKDFFKTEENFEKIS